MLVPGLPESVAPAGMPILLAVLAAVVLGLIGFAVHAGAVVVFDMLTAQSTGPKRWRLVEAFGAGLLAATFYGRFRRWLGYRPDPCRNTLQGLSGPDLRGARATAAPRRGVFG